MRYDSTVREVMGWNQVAGVLFPFSTMRSFFVHHVHIDLQLKHGYNSPLPLVPS
jgi:hypothetical protein